MNRIDEWLERIDGNTKLFTNNFKDLNNDEINWKPNNSTWSIAQVIDHLIITSEQYFKVTEQIKSGSFKPSFLSKLGFYPKLMGKFILKSVNPESKFKVKTMGVFQPHDKAIFDGIVTKFEDCQEKLKIWIKRNTDEILDSKVISSPANKNIVLRFDTAIEIIINHQLKHFNQAKSIYDLLKK